MASNPSKIGLSAEQVCAELEHINNEFTAEFELRQKTLVTQVDGARYGSAGDFHARAQAALSRAATSAEVLRKDVQDLEAKVRAAGEAFSEQDQAAEKTLSALSGTTSGTTPSSPVSAPAGTGSSSTTGFHQ
jgi:ABC-type Zn uptake system ZnuABC Zn-binding protein ZnuA